MRFLIDAQLPLVLATWLRSWGQDADHVSDLGLAGSSDPIIALKAEQLGAVLVSKDADFVILREPDRFALVWLRCGNASNRVLRAWIEPRWPAIIAALADGARSIEVR